LLLSTASKLVDMGCRP